ncbi:MAG: universal stress protein [Burkholderiales bacterium]|nr:universal stress protein [Burkholderiales bacterium]
MFNRILVPVDGSSRSLQAVERATSIAKAFGSHVFALTLIDPSPFAEVGHIGTGAQRQAIAAIRAASELVKSQGVPVDARVVESHITWKGILEFANILGIDLIVMGAHGQRGPEHLVLGSVTQQVLRHAALPVMIVQDEAQTDQASAERGRSRARPTDTTLFWRAAKELSERIAQTRRQR